MTEQGCQTPAMKERSVVRMILEKGMKLLDTKGHDYAGDDSAFTNFEFTGMVLDFAISRGVHGTDLSFLALISTKLARMIELRGSGKEPKNESIEDTSMDGANYNALWGGWILTKEEEDSDNFVTLAQLATLEKETGGSLTIEELNEWIKTTNTKIMKERAEELHPASQEEVDACMNRIRASGVKVYAGNEIGEMYP